MIMNYQDEPTLLSPEQTSFRFDAYILDATYADKLNRNEVFSVKFAPNNAADFDKLNELANSCITDIEFRKPADSNKQPRKMYEERAYCYSSQLFTPKINIPYEHTDMLRGQTATIAGHLRDLPLGEIAVQIDYIDFYDVNNGIQDDFAPVVEDDYSDW